MKAAKGAVAALLCCTAFAASVPAAQGAAVWLPPTDLASGSLGFASAAMTPQGDTIVAWRLDSGGQYKLQAAVRPAGGSFGPAIDVAPFGPVLENVDIATDAAGNAIVTWRRSIGGGDLALFYSFRPAGGGFSAAQEVGGAGKRVALPDTAMDAAGNAITVFRRAPGGDNRVAYVLRPAGGDYGTQQELTGYSAENPKVAITADGTAIAAWQTTSAVETARRPAGGSFGSIQSFPVTASSPRLSAAANGRALLTWTRFGAGESIVEASLAEPGGAFGAPTPLSSPGINSESFVAAIDPTGLAFVAWRDGSAGPLRAALARPGAGFEAAPLPAGMSGFPAGAGFVDSGSLIFLFDPSVSAPFRLVASTRGPAGDFGPPTTLGPLDKSVFLNGLSADGKGNSLALFSSNDGGGNSTLHAAGYDGEPPRFLSLSVPASTKTGVQTSLSASVLDVWSPATVEWKFGDGSSAGGDSVSHTYGPAGGKLQVEVTATDAHGNSRSEQRTIEVKDATPVVIRGAKFNPSRFAVAGKSTAIVAKKARRGSRLRYRLSEPAQVRIAIERAGKGRRKGKRCVAPQKSPLGKRCTRFVRMPVKPLKRSGKAGPNRIAFTGRMRGKALAPGSYRATLTATDTGGLKSKPKYARFTIARP